MFCPNCGKEVGNATKFCPACGTPLGRSHVGKPRGGRRRVIIVIVAACVVIIGCAVGVFQYNREKNSIWVPTSMQIEIDGQEEAAYADYNSAQFLAGAGLYNYYPRADLAFSMNEMLEGGYPAVKINLNIDEFPIFNVHSLGWNRSFPPDHLLRVLDRRRAAVIPSYCFVSFAFPLH